MPKKIQSDELMLDLDAPIILERASNSFGWIVYQDESLGDWFDRAGA